MALGHFTGEALSEWMKDDGPDSDIVISSRIRIARNLRNYPFPMLAVNQQSEEVLEKVGQVLGYDELGTISRFQYVPLSELNDLEKRVLVEKHLISPSLANESRNGAVILSDNESISIMVNEEDHLRIQVLCSGFQIREAWDLANQLDDVFENHLDYAFDEARGYLTSCPTNVGTGIRASVMIHLPALVFTQQINRILQAIAQVGLAVRGIYGEGSEAVGNLFQISNQITLGQTEEEILDNLHSVVRQIIEHERAARGALLSESRNRLADRVRRSYGILSQAIIMDSKEASQRLSDVRLGIDLGLLPAPTPRVLNELMVMTQPGFLQQRAGGKLSPEERDLRRADLIRERLSEDRSG
ncbi:protein-arginine kinase [Paenibacillus sp. J31TS4]|uniref:protein arginine kinase n=1 Tax=Paenibacillus sp. J31TS4 TaxID=2807195 RepID=UPI001B1F8A4A|nr:protein arginine kinase [Paenibacillus sp. J31TS4]GIP41530.1 protein-arginine kinase [Paenibacillus sp. J31TS4]